MEPMTREELLTTLITLRDEIASKSRAYAATLKGLNEVLTALREPGKNPVALKESVGKLRKDGEGVLSLKDLAPAFEQLEEIAQKEMKDSAFTFKRDLQAAFGERNIPLDTSGRDRFFADPFHIEADGRRGKVDILYGHNVLNAKPIPLEPALVVAGYLAARKALVERKSTSLELLKAILEAYKHTIAQQGKNFGDRVGVIDVYRELVWLRQTEKFREEPSKSSFTEYPRACFAYDVRQLQASKTLTHKGSRLQFGTATIDATDDRARSIWIPEGAEGGHYVMDVYCTKEGA
jgi:hypothetical protein